jgi:outer membrane protein
MPRFVLILTASLLVAAPALAQSGPKIGIVNFQQALNEVEEGKTAKATLEGRYEQARQEVEAKKAEVEQLAQDLEAQRPMLSDDALRDKESDYQSKMIEFQQIMMEQQTMALMEQELTGEILEKLYAVAGTIGAEGGFNLIIESSAVVYVNGTTDITDQVIARFNNKQD